MASEKQIAANRANSKRSTGPKTLAGKMVSSRNAYRHGLSGPLRPDPAASAKIAAIAHALAGEQASEVRLASATDFAQAQLELLRIRTMRAELMEKVELDNLSAPELRRLAALDRYERYFLTWRRRARSALTSSINDDGRSGET